MKNKSSSGFTIFEVLVAMLATSILILIVGLMLYVGWLGWRRNSESVNMQRDASLAMRIMAREIRRTPIDEITIGNSLICANTNGTYSFTMSGDDLNLQKDSDPQWALIRDCVSSFSTSKTNAAGVVVTLNLDTGSDDSNNKMIIYSRN